MANTYQSRIDAFQHKMLEQIPLTRYMGLERVDYDGRDLAFELTLAENHNDKGTAFAGSLSAAANLCGWGAVTLLLEDEAKAYDVVIRDSRLEYRLPVTQDFRVQARLPEAVLVDAFIQRLRDRGKARIDLSVEVVEQGKVCFSFSGSYVALEKKQWV
ncbi:MAG: YiiD C-terminal domain-containing protein [Halopseudomonas sp.]